VAKSFEFELKVPAEELIERTRKAARSEGLAFYGDARAGNIVGHGFEGGYEITDDKIAVTIKKKPLLVPWFAVESKLKSFLA